MSAHNRSRRVGKLLLGLMAVSAPLVAALVAMGASSKFYSVHDGRYHSSGKVLLSDGRVISISQTLVLDKGRFHSLTRNAALIAEASGRVETDLLGRVRLLVEERHVTRLAEARMEDDELMFSLMYGRQRGAQVTLEQVGGCLYGVETRQVYCADDHPRRD